MGLFRELEAVIGAGPGSPLPEHGSTQRPSWESGSEHPGPSPALGLLRTLSKALLCLGLKSPPPTNDGENPSLSVGAYEEVEVCPVWPVCPRKRDLVPREGCVAVGDILSHEQLQGM